jgi:hypothetical protein
VCFYAAGKLNNTKSVGFALDTYLSSEIYRFLKRAVPIKRVDFAVVALDIKFPLTPLCGPRDAKRARAESCGSY